MNWDLLLKVLGSLAIAILIFVGVVYVVGVPKEVKSKAEAKIAQEMGEGAMKDALQAQIQKVPEGDLSSVPFVGDAQQKGLGGVGGASKGIGEGVGNTTKGIGESAGGITSGLGQGAGNTTSSLGEGVGKTTKGLSDAGGGLTGGLLGKKD